MLGKLIKHEFRATGRIMLPVLGAELLLSILAGFSVRGLGRVESQGFLSVTYVSTLTVFFLGLFALGVVAMVLMIQRFYRNLLRDEGYLSMTLPVSTDEQIWAKLIVSFVWFAAVTLLILLAMLLMICIGSSISIFGLPRWSDLMRMLGRVTEELGAGNLLLFVPEMLLLAFFGCSVLCLRCYASLSIGCSAADHKLAFSFLAFIVIGMALGILRNTAGAALMNLDLNEVVFEQHFATARDTLRAVHVMLWLGILISAAESAIFYFLTRWFLKNRLNLA